MGECNKLLSVTLHMKGQWAIFQESTRVNGEDDGIMIPHSVWSCCIDHNFLAHDPLVYDPVLHVTLSFDGINGRCNGKYDTSL